MQTVKIPREHFIENHSAESFANIRNTIFSLKKIFSISIQTLHSPSAPLSE